MDRFRIFFDYQLGLYMYLSGKIRLSEYLAEIMIIFCDNASKYSKILKIRDFQGIHGPPHNIVQHPITEHPVALPEPGAAMLCSFCRGDLQRVKPVASPKCVSRTRQLSPLSRFSSGS